MRENVKKSDFPKQLHKTAAKNVLNGFIYRNCCEKEKQFLDLR